MAFYYVKDDGTAESGTATGDGGRYTTQKTGDWSTAFSATTEYYASIGAAVAATTPPTAGDFIFISDLHNKAYDNGASPQINQSYSLISVDDTNCDQYKPGATEELNDANDAYLLNNTGINVLFAGLDLKTGDNVINLNSQKNELTATLIDCTIRISSVTDNGLVFGNSSVVRLVNVDFISGHEDGKCIATGGDALLEWYGGSVTCSPDMTNIISIGSSGLTAKIVGVDLTQTNGLVLLNDTDYVVTIDVQNCKLGTSWLLGTPAHRGQRISMFNCDDASGGDYHRFLVKEYTGTVANNDSTYVTATEAWSYDGTTKSSIEVTTTANCSHTMPFVFELPAQYIDLSSTSTDVLTIELVYDANDITLDRESIAAFLVYPDGTTPVTPRWVTSGVTVGTGNYGIDPLSSGTSLHTSGLTTGSWTGLGSMTTATVGALKLDTSGTAGDPTVCSVRIEIYEPSIASGNLYIHPIMTVSGT